MTHPFLTAGEIADLRCLAAMVIPASAKHAIPGADDPIIFADLLGSLGHDRAEVQAGLALAHAAAGGALAGLAPEARRSLAATLQCHPNPAMAVLSRHVMLAYYRDDRVMRSLGLEPRPPFPKGHTLDPGDWSLLDPVRARAPMWRPAPR